MHDERSCPLLLLQSALKQLLSENLLDKFLAVLFLTVAYPGLSLGILFFAKKKVERILGSESLNYRDKAPGKSFIIHSESLLNTLELSLV